ncbi:M56 family metallopeptidase [Flagellimonas sp.]|uniref:M56 family metallopeptidase n=1 Tax=Flagellimonas sp. TaxID=2058762 RepID=UPI003B5061DE
MEALLIHLLKSSGILFLFLTCYLLFLRKETFFNGNRWFLVMGLLISVLAPFITFTNTVLVTPLSVVQAPLAVAEIIAPMDASATNPWFFISTIYPVGVAFMTIRLTMQFLAIKKLMLSANLIKDHSFYHVQTLQKISPFSFFRYIFYHKTGFSPSELQSVIEHEKVHAREHHSMDILLIEFALILLWFNPAIWYYRKALKQNLEFLADAQSCGQGEEKKIYQYLMLKQTIGTHSLSIANPFYNSLIKKRIVMLNQNQSKRTNMFKMCFVVPALALFLVSFNTKTEFIYNSDHQFATSTKTDDKSIKLIINKDTSNEELEKIKKDLAKDGIDLSYTTVHNAKGEIIDISIQISGKGSSGENFSGNYNSNSEGPIKPITPFYDDNTNTISFGNSNYNSISIHSDSDHQVWISTDTEKHENITIEEKNGVKKILHNGKEISEEELEDLNIQLSHDHEEGDIKVHIDMDTETDNHKHITIKKHESSDNNIHEEVTITKKLDVHTETDTILGSNGLLFRNLDSKGKPLYYIDGKKAMENEVQKLSPDEIKSINVFKGESAIDKYGRKARNGVIEITTKKNK